MNKYIPSAFPPPDWQYAPCPLCGVLVRSGKAETLPRAVARHVTIIHPGQHPPAPEASQETHKTIAIVAVHYLGSRKRLSDKYAALKTAVVPVEFPGSTGVAVVCPDGVIRIYERLGAGVSGWKVEDGVK